MALSIASMGRNKSWKPTDGRTSEDHLSEAFQPCSRDLCLKGIPYESRMMKTGIVVNGPKGLEPWAPSLLAFFETNSSTKTSFDQEDVEAGLAYWHNKEEYKASVSMLAANAVGKQMSPNEFLKDQAYAWRVMVSHATIKAVAYHKSRQDLQSPTKAVKLEHAFLQPMYDLVGKLFEVKKKKVVCPLKNFKFMFVDKSSSEGEEEDESTENEEEDGFEFGQIVYEGWSVYLHAAIVRSDDGQVQKAKEYSNGDDGFAVAHFEDGKS